MKKYLHLMKISFINALDYRQELLTNFLISLLIFAAMAIFWRAVFIDHEIVKGFDFAGMIQYYIVLNIMLDIVDTQLAFKLSNDIIKGNISNLLLKPVKIKNWLIISELGQLLLLVLIKIIVFGIFYALFIGQVNLTISSSFFVILLIPFSYLINANMYFIFGCLAFWLGNVKGLLYGIRRILFFLSGGMIPLVFFPEKAQRLLAYLPFRYVFQFPSEIIKNGISLEFWSICLGMVIWLIVLSFLANRFFIYSYKHNESVGI